MKRHDRNLTLWGVLGLALSAPALAQPLSLDDAKKDPRFSPQAPFQDARVKVLASSDKFPYYGIPDNGCGKGKLFLMVELASAYDGASAGQKLVLRLDDAALPPDKLGASVTFPSLRRAGKGPDGTFVYCGKLPASLTASTVASTPLPPPPPPPPVEPDGATHPPAPAATAAPGRPPLAPVPDNGFVTEVHKTRGGAIVFAGALDAVVTPEKPDKFKDSFAATEGIFFRAYLPRSLNNAFRAEGVDCQEPFRVWQLKLDGVVVPRGKDDPYFYWEPLDEKGFTKSTSIRFEDPLNGKKPGEASIGRAFTELVAPKLTRGDHTLILSVSGKCSSKNTKPTDAYLAAPLAQGTFKLSVAQAMQTSVLSKSGMKDLKLQKEAISVIEAQWGGDKVLKLVLVGKEWSVETIVLKGTPVPQKRRLDVEALVQATDGKCRVFNLTLIQPAVSMKKFGATEFATGDSREVDCGAAKGSD